MERIKDYKGNDEEFKKLNDLLEQPYDHETIYYDDDKKIKKYEGKIRYGDYEGRGILYDKSGEIIYNGYFVKGKYEGYGRKFHNKELIYEGYFKNDYKYGRGTLYYNNNKKYEGYFERGGYEGIGIEYFKNGKRIMEYKKGEPEKQCYGILYDNNNNQIYEGLLIDQRPKNTKNATILYTGRYDNRRAYVGDFFNYKYHGNGILYYEYEEKIYFKGIFCMEQYKSGILYDPEGKEIYNGEFINNYPKEGKNIRIYSLDGNLEYEGDFLNGLYDGKGKLYEKSKIKYEGDFKRGIFQGYGKGKLYKSENIDDYLLYEGNFVNGIIEGNGILYYQNGKMMFNGIFKDGSIYGKGIKYYINGSKKIEGIFKNINSCKGKYFNPKNEELYEGLIINDIPIKCENIIIYDDYTYKIYEGEINDGKYNGKGIEYSNCIENMILYKGYFMNNYYINPNCKYSETKSNIILLSYLEVTGKSSLIERLSRDTYRNSHYATHDIDFTNYKYKYNQTDFKIIFWDTTRLLDRVFHYYSRNINLSKIIIYVVDLNEYKEIPEQFFKYMENNISENEKKLIYVVGNKLDLGRDNVDKYRKYIKILIDNEKVNKYFEVSVKTNEGIDILRKNIQIDSAIFLNKGTFWYKTLEKYVNF